MHEEMNLIIIVIIIVIIIMIIIIIVISQPEHNIKVAPLKYWVYKILKLETNFAETAARFTTHLPSGISQTSKKN